MTERSTMGGEGVDATGRQTWDAYFLELARTTATRATCLRRKHGAVIVQERRIVSTGYNGAPSGHPHCTEGACPRARSDTPQGHDYSQCIAIHAEANALLFSGPAERANATLYCTGAPCFGCAKLIANSGIGEVVASGGRYDGWDRTREFLLTSGVRVRLLDGLDHLPTLDLHVPHEVDGRP
ncbi:deoxycytidylate deaminase [Salsipaludibacter albus]|uniref:deoxycytidylate deaminase n=1 Tax=Salsipaludibacter albus TaxID=2849650 RepID=UPI001EE45C7B|nr:dCMP deaminase family protein [Salsipaludibacter albus]